MALPIVKQPVYEIFLHSLKKTTTFRPYTTGEEKILMMVSNSDDPKFVVNNIRKVLGACLTDPSIDINTIASYDIENLLIKIRAKSSGETLKLTYKDEDDKTKYPLEIDLDSLDVIFNEEHVYKIEITDKIGIIMKDLNFDRMMYFQEKVLREKKKKDMKELQVEVSFETMLDCIESLYDENEVYKVGENTTREEVTEFINAQVGISPRLYKFVETMPAVKYQTTLPNGKFVEIKDIKSFLAS
jgi:hypothetical protein